MPGVFDYLTMKKTELREVKAQIQAENDKRDGLVRRREALQEEIAELEAFMASRTNP